MSSGRAYVRLSCVASLALCAMLFSVVRLHAQSDPLPSWNDTAPKKAIAAFVEKVAKEGSPDFVPAAERVGRRTTNPTRATKAGEPWPRPTSVARYQSAFPTCSPWPMADPILGLGSP